MVTSMIRYDESPEIRAEYCLDEMERLIHLADRLAITAPKSEAVRKLDKEIMYWDRMVLLAAIGTEHSLPPYEPKYIGIK